MRFGRGLALVVVLLTAACSSGPNASKSATSPTRTPSLPPNAITNAAAATARAGSAQLTFVSDAGPGRVTQGTGVVDFTGDRAHLIEQDQESDQVLLAEEAAFVSVLLREGNPKPWQRWPRTAHRFLLARPDVVDPARMLDYAAAAGGKLTSVGAEPVGGATAQHYRATADISDGVHRAAREQSRAFRIEETRAGISSVTLDVWIDDRGRIRREVVLAHVSSLPLTTTLASPGTTGTAGREGIPTTLPPGTSPVSGHPASIVSTIEFAAFGAPAVVDIPQPDRVVDAPAA
jgi:hypothetical protein